MASKAEYLKKYLSGESSLKKKKKRRKIKQKNIVIHDEDVDWKTIVPKTENSDEEDDPGSRDAALYMGTGQ